jgi:hypothetical protein
MDKIGQLRGPQNMEALLGQFANEKFVFSDGCMEKALEDQSEWIRHFSPA